MIIYQKPGLKLNYAIISSGFAVFATRELSSI